MAINALKLRKNSRPERTKLYEFDESRDIVVVDRQSRDQVVLEYCMGKDEIGYFAEEYRPEGVQKEGAKLIDITAVWLDCTKKYGRWHLYEMKGALAVEHTAVQLCNQWNAGLQYLQKNILEQLSEYSMSPDLGVIARTYDEERMKRIRDDYQRDCDEIENTRKKATLAQRKKGMDIVKYRAVLKACQTILNRKFQAENGNAAYEIHIRSQGADQIYNIKFPV